MKFSYFAEISPKIKIKKNKKYPFIDMKSISPGERFVSSQESKKFKGGGSKFQDKDILFARITPCLENGKIAQYKSNDLTPAFGSTEFFIFRAKENLINSTYLYYLCYSPIIRKTAEKSMVGASGRQRARLESLKDINFELPNLEEQGKIASILSAYDELIEKNNRRIEILEEMAETIYKEWFVHFLFPSHEKVEMVDSELGKIPEGWEVKTISDIFTVQYGKNLPLKKINKKGKYPVYGAGSVIGYYEKFVENEKVALVTCRGNGSGTVWRTREPAYITNNSFRIKPLKEYQYMRYFFIEQLLKNSSIQRALSGSAQPQITINGISYLSLILPHENIIKKFISTIREIPETIDIFYRKNENLKETRDILLPKLISGKIDVSDLDIKIEEKK